MNSFDFIIFLKTNTHTATSWLHLHLILKTSFGAYAIRENAMLQQNIQWAVYQRGVYGTNLYVSSQSASRLAD